MQRDAAYVRAFLADCGGELTEASDEDGSNPDVYWLKLRPKATTESFFVRIGWERYPGSPPSVLFADSIGGSTTIKTAWPVVPGYRAGVDICSPFTKEGYITHPEWVAQYPWPTTGNPFLWVAEILQGDLGRRYGGRAA